MTDPPHRKPTPYPRKEFTDIRTGRVPTIPVNAPVYPHDDETTDRTEDRVATPGDMRPETITHETIFAELREIKKILEAHGKKIEAVHAHTIAIAALTENVNKLWSSAMHSRDAQDKTGRAMKEFRKAMTAASKAFEMADDDERDANGGNGQ